MATKIKFNFKKAKFKIAWLKALKVIFGLELQTAKIAVDSGEFYYTLKDNETYEAICIKVAEVCGTIGESFFSEEEIKNVMSIVEPQIESHIGSSSWGYLHHSYYRRVNNNLIRYGCYTRFVLYFN